MDELTMVRNLATFFSKKGFFTKQEVSAGYGRADLVLVKLNKAKCKIRKNRRQLTPLLKEDFFQILRQLPDIEESRLKDPISLSQLSNSVSVSKSYLKYHLLRELEDFGYVKQVEKEYFYKVNGWVPLVKEMIAIEAKLQDWNRGFIQANRYKSFADRSYLAVLSRYSHRINLQKLASHNIGLFLLSDDGKHVNEIIKPTLSERIKQDKRNYVSELYLHEAVGIS